MQPFIKSQAHYFDSAREAIDAVSTFEASTESDWDYQIVMNDFAPFSYFVAVYDCDEDKRPKAGYLAI